MAKETTKKQPVRAYFKAAYADTCYLGEKSINLVFNPQGALQIATYLLNAVNAGRKKIDFRINDPGNGVMKSGSRARITVTSPIKKNEQLKG